MILDRLDSSDRLVLLEGLLALDLAKRSDLARHAARCNDLRVIKVLDRLGSLSDRADVVGNAVIHDSLDVLVWYYQRYGHLRSPVLAVEEAADRGNFESLVLLFELGQWPGETPVPLTAACVWGRADAAQWLLDKLNPPCQQHAPLWAYRHGFPAALQERVRHAVRSTELPR